MRGLPGSASLGGPRCPTLRSARFLVSLLLLGALPACGRDEASGPLPGANDPTTPATKAPASTGPERTVISKEEEEDLRSQVLEGRDTPKAVGDVAPRFRALAENHLSVVVFLRGEWDPGTRKQLGELQDNLAKIEATGARVVVVSADHPADIDDLRARLRFTFPMVSDPDVVIAGDYGVRQKDKELALPSVFVVGADGKIRFVRVGHTPLDGVSIDDLLAALKG